MAQATKRRTNPNRVFLSRAKNRPYLPKAPADIVSAAFFLDLKLQKKVMKLLICNRGDRAITALTVLARYLDKNGEVIGLADGHIVLRLTGIFCAAHQTTHSSKTVVLPYQDIAGIEAYITTITYENGETDSFSPEDYILTPQQAMLEEETGEADFHLMRRRLGESCLFVPQMSLGEDGECWLCACGAVATGDPCAACSMHRETAEMLASPKKRAAWLRGQRTRSLLLRILPYTAALALFCGGMFVLHGYLTHYREVTLPADRLAVTRQYIEENRFREALGYSTSKNQSLLYDEILDAAVAYYCDRGRFAEAAAYEQCRSTPQYEAIYESAARAFIDGSKSESCVQYALAVADDALYNGVLRRLSEEAVAAGDRRVGCVYALQMRGEEGRAYADSVLYDTIAALLEASQYENAVACIARLTDTSGVAALCRGIESELLDRGRYEDAFTVAAITGDTSVFARAYSTAGAGTIRHYYDQFSACMSAEEKRSFNAVTLSAGGSLTRIQSGTAIDTVYGELCQNAVSVATGGAHVLVLQRDGTVRAFGDNAVGQCACEGITDAVAIAAGERHSLVLLADGTVRAFGDNTAGQCDTETWRNIIAIGAGSAHSIGITADAVAVAAGSNASGQCDVADFTQVTDVACGDYATVLLHRDGSIAVLGNLSLAAFDTRAWEDVTAVSVGNRHLVALTAGGRVLTAGESCYASITDAEEWSRVRALASSGQSIYGIDAYGQILLCGSDTVSLHESGWETSES